MKPPSRNGGKALGRRALREAGCRRRDALLLEILSLKIDRAASRAGLNVPSNFETPSTTVRKAFARARARRRLACVSRNMARSFPLESPHLLSPRGDGREPMRNLERRRRPRNFRSHRSCRVALDGASSRDSFAVGRKTSTGLVRGETGTTGKELIASVAFFFCLHRRSARLSAPLVRFNCASIPDGWRAELFGHTRGAFPRRRGRARILLARERRDPSCSDRAAASPGVRRSCCASCKRESSGGRWPGWSA